MLAQETQLFGLDVTLILPMYPGWRRLLEGQIIWTVRLIITVPTTQEASSISWMIFIFGSPPQPLIPVHSVFSKANSDTLLIDFSFFLVLLLGQEGAAGATWDTREQLYNGF